MATYSIAEAKNALPRLIDQARAGEDVVITRRGRIIAELRPRDEKPDTASEAFARLQALREAGPTITMTSVELLNAMYEDDL